MLSLGTALPQQSFLGEHTRDFKQFSYLINRKSWSDFYRAATDRAAAWDTETKEFRHMDRSAKGKSLCKREPTFTSYHTTAEEEGRCAAGKLQSAFKANRCRTLNSALRIRNTAHFCRSSYKTKKTTDATSSRMLLVQH